MNDLHQLNENTMNGNVAFLNFKESSVWKHFKCLVSLLVPDYARLLVVDHADYTHLL